MKVLRREDFMKMPEGTMFAKGKKWYFGTLCYKADTLGADFIYLDLVNIESHDSTEWAGRLDEMLNTGASYPIDNDGFGRDGGFDEDDLFLVFEKADLLTLRGRIDEALAVFK